MARPVTDAAVRALIPDTSIADLAPFIVMANQLVNRLAASACGSELLDEELESIETMLAAHFAAVTDPAMAATSEKFEDSATTFSRGSSKSGTGIMSTQFGQMANTLSNGCLETLTKKRASGTALGGAHYSE